MASTDNSDLYFEGDFDGFLEVFSAKLHNFPLESAFDSVIDMLPSYIKVPQLLEEFRRVWKENYLDVVEDQNERQNSKMGMLQRSYSNLKQSSRNLLRIPLKRKKPKAKGTGISKWDNHGSYSSNGTIFGMDISKVKQSAVLVLFYPDENGTPHFCMTERQKYDGPFSGEMCLPGGKLEPEDAFDLGITARRETFEEVGVPVSDIQILSELTKVITPGLFMAVTPFIGFCKTKPVFKVSEREVAHVYDVPLSALMDDGNKKVMKQKLPGFIAKSLGELIGKAFDAEREMDMPFFHLCNQPVFGITACILMEVKQLMLSKIPS